MYCINILYNARIPELIYQTNFMLFVHMYYLTLYFCLGWMQQFNLFPGLKGLKTGKIGSFFKNKYI